MDSSVSDYTASHLNTLCFLNADGRKHSKPHVSVCVCVCVCVVLPTCHTQPLFIAQVA